MGFLQEVPDVHVPILPADVEHSRPCQGPVPCRVPLRCTACLKERSSLNTSLKGTVRTFAVTQGKVTMIFFFKYSSANLDYLTISLSHWKVLLPFVVGFYLFIYFLKERQTQTQRRKRQSAVHAACHSAHVEVKDLCVESVSPFTFTH